MARMHHFIGLAALSFALTGCVTSTDKYTAVKLENEQLRTQLGHEIRQHCEANFGLDSVVNRIVDHYRLVLADHAETSHAGAADAASISARKTAASLVGEPASVIASRL